MQRGDVTVWLSPNGIEAWDASPSDRRGAQPEFSDPAIETALTMSLVFHLPLRQAERFLRSLFKPMRVDLELPDHTTLSQQSAVLNGSIGPRSSQGPIDLIIDSSGLAIVAQGESAATMHLGNGRGGWRRLHLGVGGSRELVAQILTESNIDDGTTGVGIIEGVGDPILAVMADAAYDTKPIHDAAQSWGAEVVGATVLKGHRLCAAP